MQLKQGFELLDKLKEQLNTVDEYSCYVWRTYAASSMKTLFGEDSNEYTEIEKYQFYYINEAPGAAIKRRLPSLQLFLDNCKTTLQLNGIYRPPNRNIFTRYKDAVLVPVLLFIIGGISYASYELGKATRNPERDKNTSPTESTTTSNVPKNDTSTNDYKNVPNDSTTLNN